MSKQITPPMPITILRPIVAVAKFDRFGTDTVEEITMEGDKPDTVELKIFGHNTITGADKILEFQNIINTLIESFLPLPRTVEELGEEPDTTPRIEED